MQITTDDHTLNLHEAGPRDGVAVVLLHSLGGSAGDWTTEIERISRLHRAIAIDLPGFGESAAFSGPVGLTSYADAVLRALDKLGVDRFAIVGLSMGGMVALQIAAREPGRCIGLVLASTTAAVDESIKGVLATCDEAIAAGGMELFAEGMVPQIFGSEALEDPTPAVQAYVARLRSSDPDGFGRAAFAIASHDVTERLSEVSCPTLIVHGDGDVLIPMTHARRIADLLPHAELHVFESCGHMTTLERPTEFGDLLSGFLASVSPGDQ